MSGVVSYRVAAATALLCLFSLLDGALASKKFDSTELMAQCRGQGDKQAAIAACSEVIRSTRDRTLLERAYNRRGLAYTATKQFAQAVDDFSKVLQFDSKIAGYFDNRQRAFVGLGLFNDALRDANAAVKLAPTYPFVYHGRGAIYADLKRYDLAVQDFNTALSINASDAPLLVDRGKVFRAVGLIDNALADFNNAHAIDPNFMGALRERGLTYLSLGNADAARTDLAQVLASQPADQQDPDVVSALQQLSPAGSDVPSGRALAFSEETQSTNPVLAVPATPTVEDVRRAADQAAAEQRRKAEQEAEAARREAQAARDEAAAKLRKERFERASASAKGMIDEASAVIKANPSDPKLLGSEPIKGLSLSVVE